jgi:ribokinase
MRLAVVGHVEWVEFARTPRVPAAGEIAHAQPELAVAAGGGAVVAVELARLAGAATLFTAFGEDALGEAARAELERRGVTVRAALRSQPTRRALTLVDDAGERTIVTLGERLAPSGADPLPWDELAGADAVYFTAGDAGAARAARAARLLAANPRGGAALREVVLDALIYSAGDPLERATDLGAALRIETRGADGGTYETATGERGRWDAIAPAGPRIDSYGCGDSFAAGVVHALAEGRGIEEALASGARSGSACLTRRGPYDEPRPAAGG